MGATIRFAARVEDLGQGGRFAVRLPDAAPHAAVVEGLIGGFPFRAPVEPNDGSGLHIVFSAALLGAIRAEVGDSVDVEITRIDDEPEVRHPSDLVAALARAPDARAVWPGLTPMARREWVRWVCSAKKLDTRASRIETACDMLAHGKRRPCCFPGINFVTHGLVAPSETWTALPATSRKRGEV